MLQNFVLPYLVMFVCQQCQSPATDPAVCFSYQGRDEQDSLFKETLRPLLWLRSKFSLVKIMQATAALICHMFALNGVHKNNVHHDRPNCQHSA